MPKSHQRYLEWTPSRIVRWAGTNGPNTKQLITCILQSKTHPEQGFRSCLGIMRLGKRYSSDRLEAACLRALLIKAYSFKSVESILKKNLDRQPFVFEQDETEQSTPHGNVRGTTYYQEKGDTRC
jgi:transposase